MKAETLLIFYLNIFFLLLVMFTLLILSIVVLNGSLYPIILYLMMLLLSSFLIMVFSDVNEIRLKIKLSIFFFSLYLIYSLINHYILINTCPEELPFNFTDEQVFYGASKIGIPYVSGEKSFFELFSIFEIHELPLHVVFSSSIAYLAILVDGNNSIIAQKLLSPFFGSMLLVVMYSTLKFQFKDRYFALKATFMYGFFSAVFMYSTPLLRDIDVALAYMIFIYLFLQPNSFKNLLTLLFISFLTIYLRVESGLVLYGTTLLYVFIYVKELKHKSVKFIFYILFTILFFIVILLVFERLSKMIVDLDTANTLRATAKSSGSSIVLGLKKLPFGIGYIPMVLFGQMQPFPFLLRIDRPPEAISGLLWPFIFVMMIYAMIKEKIRLNIDIKVKYLLVVAIIVLFLMSSEANTRRMMSVYPILYIVSLYVFYIIPKNNIQRMFIYYMFSIVSLNIVYYLLKV